MEQRNYTPEEVFVAAGFPKHTYVAVEQGDKETQLQDGLAQTNKIISIAGPSKCGKTTLCDKVMGTINGANRLYITGDLVRKPDDLWLEAYRQATDDTAPNFFEISQSQQLDQILASELPLIIDDFHYISRDVQSTICRQMKNAASRGLKIICLSVPHRSDDSIRSNPDLSGRVFSVDFSFWDNADLERIATEGFQKVGYPSLPWFNSRLAHEAVTSPQIMQTLCLEACLVEGLDHPIENANPNQQRVMEIIQRALRSYRNDSNLSILKRGPTRGGKQRRLYQTKSPTQEGVYVQMDVYQCLVASLVLNPPFQQLHLDQLRQRVQRFLDYQDEPDIRRVLRQINQLFKDPSSRPLDWDDEKQLLTIADPHFYFYLRNCENSVSNS